MEGRGGAKMIRMRNKITDVVAYYSKAELESGQERAIRFVAVHSFGQIETERAEMLEPYDMPAKITGMQAMQNKRTGEISWFEIEKLESSQEVLPKFKTLSSYSGARLSDRVEDLERVRY